MNGVGFGLIRVLLKHTELSFGKSIAIFNSRFIISDVEKVHDGLRLDFILFFHDETLFKASVFIYSLLLFFILYSIKYILFLTHSNPFILIYQTTPICYLVERLEKVLFITNDN